MISDNETNFKVTNISKDGNAVKKQKKKAGIWEKTQLRKNNISLETTVGLQETESKEKFDFVFGEDFGFISEDEDDLDQGPEFSEDDNSDESDKLPIERHKERLLELITENQVVIIIGHTGSGKSTKLPQFLVENLNAKKVCVTQPRRLAAISIATRVSEEMGVVLGEEVGYGVRFDDNFDKEKGKIRYATDGILLKELSQTLNKENGCNNVGIGYDAIVIDEAHERTLNNDIILSLLKYKVLPNAPKDFKLIITSATINAMKFSEFFSNCPIYEVEGKNYPIKVNYIANEEEDYLKSGLETVMTIYKQIKLGELDQGDILLFLTGQDEINSMMSKLKAVFEKLNINNLLIYPIYANLSLKEQSRIFESIPKNCFKLIIATNIAETSITLPNIKYVIDSGKIKTKKLNSLTQISELVIETCSKAQANQRAGRTGRTGPGSVYRLYTHNYYNEDMHAVPIPEIMRENLSKVMIQLLKLGLNLKEILQNFPMLDKPTLKQWRISMERLIMLGGIDSLGNITKLGRFMGDLPSDIGVAKVISVAVENSCWRECCIIAAMMEEFKLKTNYQPQQTEKADENHRGASFEELDVLKEFKNKILTFKNSSGDCLGDLFLYLLIYLEWIHADYSSNWCKKYKISIKMMLKIKMVYDQLTTFAKQYYPNIKENENNFSSLQFNSLNFADIKFCFIKGYPNNLVKLGRNNTYNYSKPGKSNLSLTIHPSSIMSKKQVPVKKLFYITIMKTNREYIKDGFQADEIV
ncbi:hypothetical protein QEN19_000179 [Hanseniaspora menglaensis]